MKKLMIAASAALIATVGFSLESANVVGYTETGLRSGSKGVGACFVNIDGNPINLQNLKVTGYDVEAGYEAGGISVQTLDKYGRTVKTYFWYDIPGDVFGWFDDTDNYVEDVSIAPGEALYAMSPDDTFGIQTAGQVPTADTAVVLRSGSKLVANPTPVAVNLNDMNEDGNCILLTGYDVATGYEAGEVSVQTLDKYGRTVKTYFWYDIPGDVFGWFDDTDNYVEDVIVAPGESLYAMSPNESFSIIFPGVTL